jgi:L-seryl-tRNA(Ser) seleniumtransferase
MSDATLIDDSTLNEDAAAIFTQLGARPVINAAGAYTILGGSKLSPTVRAAMEDANRRFVDMKGLLTSSGRIVAEMLGAEAALVTSGAAAALALSAAACLTRDHPDYLERMPDTQGIPNEILTQKSTRQKYDRCVTLTGARLVEFGADQGATPAELRAAIGPKTVAVHYFVPFKGEPVLSLEAVLEIAHERGLPVIVDAAGLTYPVDNLRRFARMGADLVCYAAKYFDAPHSTGMIVGKKALVDVAFVNSFIGFETSGYLTIGRPMKVDRQEIVATVVALKEWLAMDHEARLIKYGERVDAILDALRGVPDIEAYRISERETPIPVIRDGARIILLSPEAAVAAEERLRDGEPSIWVRTEGKVINLSVAFFDDADLEIVASRLRQALT